MKTKHPKGDLFINTTHLSHKIISLQNELFEWTPWKKTVLNVYQMQIVSVKEA